MPARWSRCGTASPRLWRALARAGRRHRPRASGATPPPPANSSPTHRRDGAGSACWPSALIAAMAVWFAAAGPIGAAVTTGCRSPLGNGALLLPLAAGRRRRPPAAPGAASPEARGRMLVGVLALIALPCSGCSTCGRGSPRTATGRAHAGGAVGALTAARSRAAVGAVLAVPLLLVLGAFGIAGGHRDADQRAARPDLRDAVAGPRGADATPAEVNDAAPAVRWRRSRGAAQWRAAATTDGAAAASRRPRPLTDAVATEPAAVPRPRKPRCRDDRSRPAADHRPTQLELARRRGLYTLPSLTALAPAARTWSTPRPTTRSSPRCSRCSPSSTSTARSPGSAAARR